MAAIIRFLATWTFRLNSESCNLLLQAFLRNDTMEEIHLTGNNCDDNIVPHLSNLLKGPKCKIKLLGLGQNKITRSGKLIIF